MHVITYLDQKNHLGGVHVISNIQHFGDPMARDSQVIIKTQSSIHMMSLVFQVKRPHTQL